MTEKQESIVDSALKLFAEKGYHATSTSKIAQKAGVSEGLIFRHYGSKDGLLQAILDIGRERTYIAYEEALSSESPRKVLKAVIEFPYGIRKDQYYFWKLLYSLKWQADVDVNIVTGPLRKALVWAFTTMKYKNPEAEAEVVLLIIDGIFPAVLLDKSVNQKAIRKAILKKYHI